MKCLLWWRDGSGKNKSTASSRRRQRARKRRPTSFHRQVPCLRFGLHLVRESNWLGFSLESEDSKQGSGALGDGCDDGRPEDCWRCWSTGTPDARISIRSFFQVLAGKMREQNCITKTSITADSRYCTTSHAIGRLAVWEAERLLSSPLPKDTKASPVKVSPPTRSTRPPLFASFVSTISKVLPAADAKSTARMVDAYAFSVP